MVWQHMEWLNGFWAHIASGHSLQAEFAAHHRNTAAAAVILYLTKTS